MSWPPFLIVLLVADALIWLSALGLVLYRRHLEHKAELAEAQAEYEEALLREAAAKEALAEAKLLCELSLTNDNLPREIIQFLEQDGYNIRNALLRMFPELNELPKTCPYCDRWSPWETSLISHWNDKLHKFSFTRIADEIEKLLATDERGEEERRNNGKVPT